MTEVGPDGLLQMDDELVDGWRGRRRLEADEEGLRLDARAERSHHQRSEEHTSELQSLMRISYAVFCLKKKKNKQQDEQNLTAKKENKRVNTSKKETAQ